MVFSGILAPESTVTVPVISTALGCSVGLASADGVVDSVVTGVELSVGVTDPIVGETTVAEGATGVFVLCTDVEIRVEVEYPGGGVISSAREHAERTMDRRTITTIKRYFMENPFI